MLSNKEENLSVTGEILAYQDEPLATSDDGDTNIEDKEDADEDGLTSAMLLWHFEKRRLSVHVVLFNLAYLN